MITYNSDKFGYYKVGNRKTYSKVEAIEWSNSTNETPLWIFNEEVFSKVNWKTEPDISLWELYKARCKQIRESYDYVVLMFSGGSDSHNILNAWIEADCKIDEIATWWTEKAAGGITNPWIAEIPLAAMPFIESLKNKGLKFNHRLFDASDCFFDVFKYYGKDYEYYINCMIQPIGTMSSMFREKIDDYKNLMNQGKKVCFVWGCDKPNIFLQNGKYYVLFSDVIDSVVTNYAQIKHKEGWYDELFYWTPDMPEIIVKQSHIIINFLKTVNDNFFYIDQVGEYLKDAPIFGYNTKIKKYLKEETVKQLIYPKWSSDIFNAGKPTKGLYSERMDFFLKGNTEYVKRYDEILDSYFLKMQKPKRWQRLPLMYSPKYFLE